jgi:hypothetical protein
MITLPLDSVTCDLPSSTTEPDSNGPDAIDATSASSRRDDASPADTSKTVLPAFVNA